MEAAWVMSDRFPDMTRHAFSFLEDDGYLITQRDATYIQYERASSVVEIRWDPRSGELDLLIGLRSRDDDPVHLFSLTDLLMMQNADVPAAKSPFQVSEERKLGPFLDELAKNLRTFAVQALAGDRMFFRDRKSVV